MSSGSRTSKGLTEIEGTRDESGARIGGFVKRQGGADQELPTVESGTAAVAD